MSASSCRRGTATDLPGVADVARAVLPEAVGLADWLRQPASELWVAEGAEGLVGFLAAQRVGDELEILWLAVAAKHQRTGVASRLLSTASAEARNCLLEVRSNNLEAQRFYESQGFVESGRRNRYYPSGEDAILLHRQDPDLPEG